MGRGNFCPIGELTDQWYIDNDNYLFETEDGESRYDEWQMNEDIDSIMKGIMDSFKAFSPVQKYLDSYWGQVAMLESRLFWIGVADNQWSTAIWIKERADLQPELFGLANVLFPVYQKKIEEILLSMFDEVYRRNGPWMSSKITTKAV